MVFLFFAQQLCNPSAKCIYVSGSLSLPQEMYMKTNTMSI